MTYFSVSKYRLSHFQDLSFVLRFLSLFTTWKFLCFEEFMWLHWHQLHNWRNASISIHDLNHVCTVAFITYIWFWGLTCRPNILKIICHPGFILSLLWSLFLTLFVSPLYFLQACHFSLNFTSSIKIHSNFFLIKAVFYLHLFHNSHLCSFSCIVSHQLVITKLFYYLLLNSFILYFFFLSSVISLFCLIVSLSFFVALLLSCFKVWLLIISIICIYSNILR